MEETMPIQVEELKQPAVEEESEKLQDWELYEKIE